jgi:hypothetical protein
MMMLLLCARALPEETKTADRFDVDRWFHSSIQESNVAEP